MPADPGRQAQDFVRDGADLDADVAAAHLVHDKRVPRQGEAVPDAARPEQQRVHQVSVRVGTHVESLAAVEEEGDVDARGLA